jgi:transposase
MLALPNNLSIYIATQATDMRRSFDGLSLHIQGKLNQDPLSGKLFVFFNKRYDKVKMLYWEQNGYCIWYKRLEAGTYRPPRIQGDCYVVTSQELTLLLAGIDLTIKDRLGSVSGKIVN